MTTFRIHNRHSGRDLGLYDGADPAAAIAAMLLDAGCEDPAGPELIAELVEDRAEQLLAELIDLNDGTGTLRAVIEQALADDPDATADDVRAIWREAERDAEQDADEPIDGACRIYRSSDGVQRIDDGEEFMRDIEAAGRRLRELRRDAYEQRLSDVYRVEDARGRDVTEAAEMAVRDDE